MNLHNESLSCNAEKIVSGLVTIIMPCYNAENYIGEAIQSVENQTWSEWELLVIDDGSTDKSREIAKKRSDNDARIQLIVNQNNVGVSKTRNRGIDMARGEWIAFLDSDDVWEPEKLSKQLSLAAKEKSKFVYTRISMINQDGTRIGLMSVLPATVDFFKLSRWNQITCSSVMILHAAIGNLRFEYDDTREDYLLWLRLLRELGIAHAINEPLVRNRIIKGSRSANKIKMFRDTYRVHRHLKTSVVKSVYFSLSHFIKTFMSKYRNIKRVGIDE